MTWGRFAKKIFGFACGILLVLLCVCGGWIAGRRQAADEGRIDEYSSRVERAEGLAEDAEHGLGRLGDQIGDAKSEVEECLTEVGELRDYCGRIAGNGGEFEERIVRAENAVRKCLALLEEREAYEAGMGRSCSDSRCNCGCGVCKIPP